MFWGRDRETTHEAYTELREQDEQRLEKRKEKSKLRKQLKDLESPPVSSATTAAHATPPDSAFT